MQDELRPYVVIWKDDDSVGERWFDERHQAIAFKQSLTDEGITEVKLMHRPN